VPTPTNTRPKPTTTRPAWALDVAASIAPLVSVDEAASVLRCSPKTVRRRIKLGQLDALRNGSRVVIAREALLRMLGA